MGEERGKKKRSQPKRQKKDQNRLIRNRGDHLEGRSINGTKEPVRQRQRRIFGFWVLCGGGVCGVVRCRRVEQRSAERSQEMIMAMVMMKKMVRKVGEGVRERRRRKGMIPFVQRPLVVSCCWCRPPVTCHIADWRPPPSFFFIFLFPIFPFLLSKHNIINFLYPRHRGLNWRLWYLIIIMYCQMRSIQSKY